MNIFGGYEDFVNIFGGSSQNWASLRVISMQFRVFLKVKVQNWDIFGVAKISNIFLGCLKFLIFFWGERWMLGPSLRMRKKLEYPPWGPHTLSL